MAAIAIIISIVALALAARFRFSSQQGGFEARLSELSGRLTALEARNAVLAEAPPVAEPSPMAASPAPAAPAMLPAAPDFISDPATPPPARTVAAAFARIEERLMRRWFVWVGAVALALGVVFLVRYSIERGFFGPSARIASGLVVGLALLAMGEWTRRRTPALPAVSGMAPDYVPAGLSAAGIVGLFASIDAGYALYALIPATIAFVLLAGISAAAAVLALLHGRLLAVIGFVGAYAVPALIGSEHPSAAGLLAYVVVVTAGALVLLRWLHWRWLGWTIAAGAMAWGAMALLMPSHELPLGLYLLVTPILFVALSPVAESEPRRPSFAWAMALADGALMMIVVIGGGYSTTAITMAVALSALLAIFGLRDAGFDRMAWIGGVLQLALLAAWEFHRPPAGSPETNFFLVAPPTVLRSYLVFALVAAACYGAGGVLAMGRTARPPRWAFLAAAMPVAILAVVYWRVELFAASLPWAAVALALAAAYVIVLERQRSRRAAATDNAVIAAFAVAATAAIALGMTMSLRLGWLTVALSLQLPALVWLFERTQVRAVRQTALVMAAIVLARLLLNPSIADYDIGARPIFNGLLYAYGIPWLAFVAAARGFRRSGDDLLVRVLESGAIALFVALVSLEIRHAVGGSVAYRRYDLLEQGLQSDAWLAIAYGLLRRGGGPERAVRAIAWRLLLVAATANLVLFPLTTSNPLWRPVSVGAAPFLDSLLFAYLIPAIFAALFFRAFRRRGEQRLADCAGIAALVLGFVYLSLEGRHLFQGAFLVWGRTSDAEWYLYSALWLAYAVALMLIGLLFKAAELRLAGLGFGAVVATKIFVFDLAALSGLYRAASFIALGACLVGLGYLHQHLAARSAAAGATTSA